MRLFLVKNETEQFLTALIGGERAHQQKQTRWINYLSTEPPRCDLELSNPSFRGLTYPLKATNG